jgi:hypothetical protein
VREKEKNKKDRRERYIKREQQKNKMNKKKDTHSQENDRKVHIPTYRQKSKRKR